MIIIYFLCLFYSYFSVIKCFPRFFNISAVGRCCAQRNKFDERIAFSQMPTNVLPLQCLRSLRILRNKNDPSKNIEIENEKYLSPSNFLKKNLNYRSWKFSFLKGIMFIISIYFSNISNYFLIFNFSLCATNFHLSFAHLACVDHIELILDCYRQLLEDVVSMENPQKSTGLPFS